MGLRVRANLPFIHCMRVINKPIYIYIYITLVPCSVENRFLQTQIYTSFHKEHKKIWKKNIVGPNPVGMPIM